MFFPGFVKVTEGIDKAIEMGYSPVKVVCSSYAYMLLRRNVCLLTFLNKI